ncbi:hypothetical protein Kpol_473p4 [Vanderwaltozyma polyspora DSM 70294]|uniref:Growth regulation protein n=1 Tax=Vanderwaltozyma polyspora (strain ATCC 22028 / DSM 70294 / BCRC 21397 / CBS 2163 / NBRC 10782 / NRRL Y-8283 / UCD 57-17) TaxID=436907 RepID=A7TPZ6_VANPO|nr:uncharacterized protein Kpol_473p4 [Vanderwaltozyma polyspora DSM 70294]EDO15645.1 hypothetical protein Kpol_473p4 [Vanderwaltozyma polyspora DSM 70294]
MNNFITQVSQDSAASTNLFISATDEYQQNRSDSALDLTDLEDSGNALIHLNIQEQHYYITRDQLMSLPESILLYLFPAGVFLDKMGEIITNLTPDDEVYVSDFPSSCFEYIMDVYTRAYDDFTNFPVDKTYGISKDSSLTSVAKGFFGFGNNSANVEKELLHNKPVVIVLREDLDYYCIPKDAIFQYQGIFQTSDEDCTEKNEELFTNFMTEIKIAAGSYLSSQDSVFGGLSQSNRSRSGKDEKKASDKKIGTAEQHLKEMLCSSGFSDESKWNNRVQDPKKTVITSLSLCRLANETTEEFRKNYFEAKKKWEAEWLRHKSSQESISRSRVSLSRSISHNNMNKKSSSSLLNSEGNGNSSDSLNKSDHINPNISGSDLKKGRFSSISASSSHPNLSSESTDKLSQPPSIRKSRFSRLAGNVRSRSSSKNRPSGKSEIPKLYDLVPKPAINTKLLLFWRKPARKCWWSEETITLNVKIHGKIVENGGNNLISLEDGNSTDGGNDPDGLTIPVKLHIRRVWTLELSVIGA